MDFIKLLVFDASFNDNNDDDNDHDDDDFRVCTWFSTSVFFSISTFRKSKYSPVKILVHCMFSLSFVSSNKNVDSY